MTMNGNRNTKTVRKAGNRGRYLWIGGILSGFMVLLILISFFWTPYGHGRRCEIQSPQPPAHHGL